MYNVYDNDTGELIGALDYYQLQWLRSRLEEESMEDKDYAISSLEISLFESQGAPKELLDVLRKATGDKDEVIIRWKKEE